MSTLKTAGVILWERNSSKDLIKKATVRGDAVDTEQSEENS